MTILKTGSVIFCPYCEALQDDVVEDFVVPGKFEPYKTECYDCGGKFTVQRTTSDEYEVLRHNERSKYA